MVQEATKVGTGVAVLSAGEHGLQVALVKRNHGARNLAGVYQFPGGEIDPGETPFSTAIREVREEIGLDIMPTSLLRIFLCEVEGESWIDIPVVAYLDPGEKPENIRNLEPGKFDHVGWYYVNDLPTPLSKSTAYSLENLNGVQESVDIIIE